MTTYTEALRHESSIDLQTSKVVRRKPRFRLWIVFSVAVVIAFFGLIFSRISLDQTAFVLEDLEQKIAEEEARHGALRVEVARLQSPERISKLAQTMGFVYPATFIALDAPDEAMFADLENHRIRSPVLQAAQP